MINYNSSKKYSSAGSTPPLPAQGSKQAPAGGRPKHGKLPAQGSKKPPQA